MLTKHDWRNDLWKNQELAAVYGARVAAIITDHQQYYDRPNWRLVDELTPLSVLCNRLNKSKNKLFLCLPNAKMVIWNTNENFAKL